MDILAPNVKNLTRGGAIVYFDKGVSGAYLDLGNIPDFGLSTPTSVVEHKTSRSGKIVLDRRESTEYSTSFKIGIDEYNVRNMELLYNALTAQAFSQSAATLTLSVVDPVLGVAYDLGALRATSVVAKRATTITLTSGVDYNVELDLGMITFIPGGAVLVDDTVGLTTIVPAVTGDIISPLSNAGAIEGAVKIYFRSSDGRLWVWKHSSSQVSFSGDTTFSGNDFAKTAAELMLMPVGSDPLTMYGTKTLLAAA